MERQTTDSILVDFLQRQPENIIEQYKYRNSRSSEETLKVLKDFAIWSVFQKYS